MRLGSDLLSLRNGHGSSADEQNPLDNQSVSSCLKEHDYIGLADVSSVSSTKLPECENTLNLAETELDLGLGLGFGPAKKTVHAENSDETLALTLAQKEAIVPKEVKKCPKAQALHNLPARQCAAPATRDTSTTDNLNFYGSNSPALKNGMKRGYTEAMNETAKFSGAAIKVGDMKALPLKHQQAAFLPSWKPGMSTPWQAGVSSSKAGQAVATPRVEKPVVGGMTSYIPQDTSDVAKESVANEGPPPPKGQVVGWPPVRSYRKNMVKPVEMFVKVNMDGVTVGRKVDLNAHHSYESLLSALEEMFHPSNNSQGGSHASSSREDVKQFKLLNCSDFVLTYEDQDGDWMMVGDVPWSMFINMVRRLRITRGSEAIGLAPTRPENVN